MKGGGGKMAEKQDGPGFLTPDQARQRVLSGIRTAGAVDHTDENPLYKPLTGQEARRVETPDAATLKKRQEQIAFNQSLEEGQRISEAERLKQVTHPPETPAQKLARLARGETR